MKYFIATDHAGVDVKNFTADILRKKGHEVVDLGPFNTERVDYPDFAEKVANSLIEEAKNRDIDIPDFEKSQKDWKETEIYGVLICGTGIGMSISANKVSHIRAGLVTDAYTSEMARAHNNANILCFGARVVGAGVIESIIDAWESTDFEGGRHANRVAKINNIK
jgi:ribose 5-phosphate isomerase B